MSLCQADVVVTPVLAPAKRREMRLPYFLLEFTLERKLQRGWKGNL